MDELMGQFGGDMTIELAGADYNVYLASAIVADCSAKRVNP